MSLVAMTESFKCQAGSKILLGWANRTTGDRATLRFRFGVEGLPFSVRMMMGEAAKTGGGKQAKKERESKAGEQLNRVDTNWLGHDMENRQQRTARMKTRPTGRGLGWEEKGRRERTGRGGKRRGSEQGEGTRLSSHSFARHPRRRAAEWRCRWCLLVLWGRDACRDCLYLSSLFTPLVWNEANCRAAAVNRPASVSAYRPDRDATRARTIMMEFKVKVSWLISSVDGGAACTTKTPLTPANDNVWITSIHRASDLRPFDKKIPCWLRIEMESKKYTRSYHASPLARIPSPAMAMSHLPR